MTRLVERRMESRVERRQTMVEKIYEKIYRWKVRISIDTCLFVFNTANYRKNRHYPWDDAANIGEQLTPAYNRNIIVNEKSSPCAVRNQFSKHFLNL